LNWPCIETRGLYLLIKSPDNVTKIIQRCCKIWRYDIKSFLKIFSIDLHEIWYSLLKDVCWMHDNAWIFYFVSFLIMHLWMHETSWTFWMKTLNVWNLLECEFFIFFFFFFFFEKCICMHETLPVYRFLLSVKIHVWMHEIWLFFLFEEWIYECMKLCEFFLMHVILSFFF